MAKLKKYFKLNNWEALDDFYGTKINRLKVVASKNLVRCFCRCGETTNTKNEDKCPNCGCTDLTEIVTYYYEPYLAEKVNYKGIENSKGEFEIYRNVLSAERSINEEEITYKCTSAKNYIVTKDKLQKISLKKTNNYHSASANLDILENWSYFKEIKPLIENADLKYIDIENIDKYLYIKAYLYNFITDDLFTQYPKISKNILDYLSDEKNRIYIRGISYEELLTSLNINKKYLFAFDKSAGDYTNYTFRNSFRLHTNKKGIKTDVLTNVERFNYHKKNNKKAFEMIVPFFINGTMRLNDALNLMDTIVEAYSDYPYFNDAPWGRRDFSSTTDSQAKLFKETYPDEILDMFNVYLKDNVTIRNHEDIFYDFLEDLNSLKKLKVPITEENLKLKNLNLYLGKNKMIEEYDFPEERINCFIELLEINPLKALEYLNNTKKLTKEQKNNFFNEITK